MEKNEKDNEGSKSSTEHRSKRIDSKEKPANYSRLFILKKRISRWAKNYTLTPTQKKVWLGLLSLIVLTTSFLSIYDSGYNTGYADSSKDNSDSLLSSAITKNISNDLNAISGDVSAISQNEIEIASDKGEKKTVKITSKTKVTQKTTTLTFKDVKKGQKVTIFTQNEGDQVTARRIVLRD